MNAPGKQTTLIPVQPKEKKFVGVDVGTVNFSWCCQHHVGNKMTEGTWRRISLIPRGGDSYDKLYKALESWWQENDEFAGYDVIAVEKQMKKNKMIAVEAWLKGRDRRVVIVTPQKWRGFFGVGTGNYDTNKALSTTIMKPKLEAHFPKERVLADLAESWLIAYYVARLEGFVGEEEHGISQRLPANGDRKRGRAKPK